MRPFIYFLFLSVLLANCRTANRPAQVNEQPVFETTATVFDPGTSYATTRIPALVMTTKGSLLAFCEARVNNSSDWADIDMIMRRSTDGGKTWEENVVIAARETKRPTSNCTPIVDRDGKTIHVLYHRNYSNCYYVRSTDDGKTWSAPKEITYAFDQFRPEYNWKVLAPGPGHAIQLQNGQHKGRLVVPVWLCEPNPKIPGGDHRPSCVATIYSDDFWADLETGCHSGQHHPGNQKSERTRCHRNRRRAGNAQHSHRIRTAPTDDCLQPERCYELDEAGF